MALPTVTDGGRHSVQAWVLPHVNTLGTTLQVSVGGTISFTVTVILHVPTLPSTSVAEKVTSVGLLAQQPNLWAPEVIRLLATPLIAALAETTGVATRLLLSVTVAKPMTWREVLVVVLPDTT